MTPFAQRIRIALLTALLLLPASRLWAQPDLELYSAEVCNKGQITVDVAVAYRAFGFSDEFWIIDGWYEVPKGKCKTVFSNRYVRQDRNWLGFRSFPVHLAFAFTDSAGVWGAARVEPPRGIARSRLQLCVARKNFEYRVDARDPATACKGQSGAFLIPASVDFEPTSGDYIDHYGGSHGPSMSATVALGPTDRAIPVGTQASGGVTTQGPGTLRALHGVLMDIMRGPDAPKARIPNPKSLLEVCVPPTLVKKESWANPPTARTKAFKETVRQFLASHNFSNGSDGIVRIRVTETGNTFRAEEVMACPGDSYMGLSWRPTTQAAVTPPPAATPTTPQPAPGFGDLLGPGGFIKPPTK